MSKYAGTLVLMRWDHSPSQCLVLSALPSQCPPLIAWQNIAWRHSTPSFRHFVYSPSRVFLQTLNVSKNSRAGTAGDQLLSAVVLVSPVFYILRANMEA